MNRVLTFAVLAVLAVALGACKSAPAGGAKPEPAPAAKPAAAPADLKGPFQADADGFIRNWLFVGPFPNPGGRPEGDENAQASCKGFAADLLGGEAAYVPKAGKEVSMEGGKKAVWKVIAADADSVDMAGLMDATDNTVIYAACWVELEKDADVEVRVGSDDGNKLWIDNKQVAVVHEHRAASADQDNHKMKLTAGKHLVMIKVDNDWGGFSFCLRIVTPDGKKLANMKVWN
jgi:hypothetical protein